MQLAVGNLYLGLSAANFGYLPYIKCSNLAILKSRQGHCGNVPRWRGQFLPKAKTGVECGNKDQILQTAQLQTEIERTPRTILPTANCSTANCITANCTFAL
jgi:hypothetical protein